MVVRAVPKPGEERRRSAEIGANENLEILCMLGPAERAPERDGLRDSLVASELLHVPPRHEASEAVTDKMNPRAPGDPLHESRKASRDRLDTHTRRMSEACDLRARVLLEPSLHRAKDARARKKTVDEYDDIVGGSYLRG